MNDPQKKTCSPEKFSEPYKFSYLNLFENVNSFDNIICSREETMQEGKDFIDGLFQQSIPPKIKRSKHSINEEI